jgi:hypothetical protein
MRRSSLALVTLGLLLGGAGSVRADQLVIGLEAGNTGGANGAAEQAALTATLTSMGYSVVVKSAGDFSGINLFMSYPGSANALSGPSLGQIAAGVRFVQISDWGSDWTPNTWQSIAEGTTITLKVDKADPLTAGVAGTWTSKGFWRYGYSYSDFVGYNNDPTLPSLVSETSVVNQSGLLVGNEIGAGRAVYIGWNVYGPDAGPNDLRVLKNAVEWAAGPIKVVTAPEPGSLALLATGALGLAVAWRRRRRR